MKKRMTSLILTLVILLSMLVFASCGGDEVKPPIGTNAPDNTGAQSGDTQPPEETDKPEDTEPVIDENGLSSEFFSDYMRDDNAKYVGKFGIGASGAVISFDKFRALTSRSVEMYGNDFEVDTEINTSIFTPLTAAGGDWDLDMADFTIVDEDLGEEATEANRMLVFGDSAVTGAMLAMGNPDWGPCRLNVSIKHDGSSGTADIFFCVIDEKNYYCLQVGSGDNASMKVFKITDGKSEQVAMLGIGITADTWTPVSINVAYDMIIIYVGGIEYFHITDEPTDNELITGKFGFGQWNTQFYIDNFKIEDIETGETIYFQDFENASDFIANAEFGVRNGGSWPNSTNSDGDWVVKAELDADGNELDNHALYFGGATSITGAAIAFDVEIPEDCKGYKITCDGMRTAGTGAYEGWTLIWGWKSANDYIDYNLNGWSGAAGFQEIVAGVKTNTTTTELIGMKTNEWQTAEIYVYPDVTYAYFEGKFYQNLWS